MSSLPALQELKALRRWVLWRTDMRLDHGGELRATKVLYQPDGAHAKANDAATWNEFETVARVHRDFDGLGFVLTAADRLVFIDLDKCRKPETGEIEAWAQDIIRELDSYTELSPSGTGVHVLVRGIKPGDRCKKSLPAGGAVEIYEHTRFMTVTGAHLPGTPEAIEERQEALDVLYQRLFPPPLSAQPTTPSVNLDDQALLDRARRQGWFERLWRGDTSDHGGDESAADFRLCSSLAYWTQKDPARIDRLFRASGLFRAKWDDRRGSSTYGAQTIERAIAATAKVYEPRSATTDKRAAPSRLGQVLAAQGAQGDAGARLRLYDVTQTPAEETIDWRIENWVVEGQLTMWVARDKMGKSTQQWRRAEAVSRGDDYLGSRARKGRVLVVTEMSQDAVQTLLAENDIEPDGGMVRTGCLMDVAREDRLLAILEAIQEWQPDYICLDPLLECLGLDEDGPKNSMAVSDAFDAIRRASGGATVEGLHYYNGQGQIAESYKVRAKPDHIYEMKGTRPDDVKYVYRGRTQAIPLNRRVTGNAHVGYTVDVLDAPAVGRPSGTSKKIRDLLAGSTIPLAIADIAKATGVPYQATKQALLRGRSKGEFVNEGDGWAIGTKFEINFVPIPEANRYETPPNTPPVISYLSSREDSETPSDSKSPVPVWLADLEAEYPA